MHCTSLNHFGQGILFGPILKYNPSSRYQLLMTVHTSGSTQETMRRSFWGDNPAFNLEAYGKKEESLPFDEKASFLNPVLIGEVLVELDGHKVIDRKSKADRCFDVHSWIADMGIYLLRRDKWIMMYYFPHYYPQILS
ncbi:hypothetical protein ANCCAN_05244 [Ancylostoma caninum]|uniref:Uncharacterized protein n=1 Tax=Ancylostoma caninum TaxID=29170 RepID=A0A368GW64_ANCCA|nr:hypothetical protein ANCCAN_05244 [Ancylostoma caninum]